MRIQESIRMLLSQQFSVAHLSRLYNCRRHGLLKFQRIKPQVQGAKFLRGIVICEYHTQPSRHGDNVSPLAAKELEKLNIRPKSYKLLGQNQKILCPQCEGGSTKELSLALLLTLDGALWKCFRANCGWKGKTGTLDSIHQSPRLFTEEYLQLEQVSEEISLHFGELKISRETLQRNKVMQTRKDNKTEIAFTYREKGIIVNCRYYDPMMKSREETDKIVPYGLDDIKDAKDIIIVQDEFDKLSVEEAGYKNCISVPSMQTDRKFNYLSDFRTYFNQAPRILLATNADEEGQALAEEIARRIGREKCWKVKWPTTVRVKLCNAENNEENSWNDANIEHFPCKNASDVLMLLGREKLKMLIDDAEEYPIMGLHKFSRYFPMIDAYYQCCQGDELGVSTGWVGLDELYRVVPGELTIVTGVPNSGKSEWIDALLCNLNRSNGWTFALCSMENKVEEHGRKLIEKHKGKPFFCAKYGGHLPRISPEELKVEKQWLDETFCLIRCEDDSLPSIKWVLDQAKAAVLRYGIQGLVIDPYNELDHQRSNQTETEYVSQLLTMVKRFSQHHRCHVWFVAHPRQLHNWNGAPPGIYDISGSAHFINKCDNAIVIHRNRDPDVLDQVQVLVKKVRNKVAGNIGEACLSYSRVTGEFSDVKA